MNVRNMKRGAAAAAFLLAVGVLSAPAAAVAAAPETLDFESGTWNGGIGFPLGAEGSIGADGAVSELGEGLTVTVNYSEVGGAAAAGREGSTFGNLNILDAAAVADLANPGDPLPADCQSTTDIFGNAGTPANGCHETSGLTLNIESTGANNAGMLLNYVRYDFVFNQPVTTPSGIMLGDIDSLRVLYEDAFPFDYQVDLYQDAIGFELWAGPPGDPGTGTPASTALGGALASSSLDGVSYVHSSDAPVGGRGGLTNSGDERHQATFFAGDPIRGFSIYYWDELPDSALDPGVLPTVSMVNFDVVPVPSQLAVTKTVIDGADPWAFVVTVTGSDGSARDITLTDALPTMVIDVDPTVTYTVSEADVTGYTLESIDCGDGTDSFAAPYDDGASAVETTCEVTNVAVPVAPALPEIVDSKSSDPMSGATVQPGDVITYTLMFRNDGTAAGLVDSVDDLTHVLDDADLTSPPVASDAALTAADVQDGRFGVSGTLEPGQQAMVSYQVTVRADADRGDDDLANYLLPSDGSPPAQPVCDQGSEDCTVHVVPPAPDPEPTSTPEPTPDPTPEPTSTPEPTPEPTSTPDPEPTPEPTVFPPTPPAPDSPDDALANTGGANAGWMAAIASLLALGGGALIGARRRRHA